MESGSKYAADSAQQPEGATLLGAAAHLEALPESPPAHAFRRSKSHALPAVGADSAVDRPTAPRRHPAGGGASSGEEEPLHAFRASRSLPGLSSVASGNLAAVLAAPVADKGAADKVSSKAVGVRRLPKIEASPDLPGASRDSDAADDGGGGAMVAAQLYRHLQLSRMEEGLPSLVGNDDVRSPEAPGPEQWDNQPDMEGQVLLERHGAEHPDGRSKCQVTRLAVSASVGLLGTAACVTFAAHHEWRELALLQLPVWRWALVSALLAATPALTDLTFFAGVRVLGFAAVYYDMGEQAMCGAVKSTATALLLCAAAAILFTGRPDTSGWNWAHSHASRCVSTPYTCTFLNAFQCLFNAFRHFVSRVLFLWTAWMFHRLAYELSKRYFFFSLVNTHRPNFLLTALSRAAAASRLRFALRV